MSQDQKIKKEMKIREVLKKYPQTIEVFLRHGLFCVGCPFSQEESIEEASKTHQINLDELLTDLNEIIKRK